MMMPTTPEYDAFGPWIHRIQDDESIPRLFRPFADQLRGGTMVFKVPRKIERRNATPDMDLYDAIVAIFPQRLLLLERQEGPQGRNSVGQRTIAVDSIDRINRWTRLLEGVLTLHLHTGEGPVTIPYNTVSDELMRQAVGQIRSSLSKGAPGFPGLEKILSGEHRAEVTDFGFRSVCQRMVREVPDLRLAASQPTLSYAVPRKFQSRLLSKLGLKETIEAQFAILCSGHEIVMLTRTSSRRAPSADAYSFSETIIPLDRLKTVSAFLGPDGLRRLVVQTQGAREEVPCDPQNPTVDRLLEALTTEEPALEVEDHADRAMV